MPAPVVYALFPLHKNFNHKKTLRTSEERDNVENKTMSQFVFSHHRVNKNGKKLKIKNNKKETGFILLKTEREREKF